MIVDDNTKISMLIQSILKDNNVTYSYGLGEKILDKLNKYDSEMRVKKIPHPFVIWGQAKTLNQTEFFNWMKQYDNEQR